MADIPKNLQVLGSFRELGAPKQALALKKGPHPQKARWLLLLDPATQFSRVSGVMVSEKRGLHPGSEAVKGNESGRATWAGR